MIPGTCNRGEQARGLPQTMRAKASMTMEQKRRVTRISSRVSHPYQASPAAGGADGPLRTIGCVVQRTVNDHLRTRGRGIRVSYTRPEDHGMTLPSISSHCETNVLTDWPFQPSTIPTAVHATHRSPSVHLLHHNPTHRPAAGPVPISPPPKTPETRL